jgi:hypothetical protein
MSNLHQRHQILETLSVLDAEQAEKVLAYMRGILHGETDKASYQKFKREAMREIRQELTRERRRKLS